MPSAKNSVLVPASPEPLPKPIPQRPFVSASLKPPLRISGLPCVSVSWPRNLPVAGSKALTVLSPKLPIRTSFENGPKLAGAIAAPIGELSSPRVAKRRCRSKACAANDPARSLGRRCALPLRSPRSRPPVREGARSRGRRWEWPGLVCPVGPVCSWRTPALSGQHVGRPCAKLAAHHRF